MRTPDQVTVYPEGLSDKRQAAAWLNVSVSWLEKAAAAQQVPHTKVAGSLRWTPDHLRQIVEANEVQVWTYDTQAKRSPLRIA
jgi:hypothetical protein